MFIDEKKVRKIKEKYLIGLLIQLDYMNDKYPVPEKTYGYISFVDDIGTVHVNWANGSSLGVCLDEDRIHIVESNHNFIIRCLSELALGDSYVLPREIDKIKLSVDKIYSEYDFWHNYFEMMLKKKFFSEKDFLSYLESFNSSKDKWLLSDDKLNYIGAVIAIKKILHEQNISIKSV